ncbi:hypothetical protein BX666DRAFT_1968375 [Dichotomocladium elegans]|nr:hypothetical protein BX666DRAFT_1968375 [Dichotomocladium elegans]
MSAAIHTSSWNRPNSHPSAHNEKLANTSTLVPQETAIEGQLSRSGAALPPQLPEGDRERAALANVFGVEEYSESDTFWKRLAQEDDQSIATATATATTTSASTTTNTANASNAPTGNNKSLKKKKSTNISASQADTANTQHHSIHRQPIASIVTNSSTIQRSKTDPVPLTLPDIPTVSKFNDFLIEDEHGVDFLFPASPSSVLLHSPLPLPASRSFTASSVHSSIHLPAELLDSEGEKGPAEGKERVPPPRLFIGYPPSIFDMLKSDDDERIIIWGPGDRTTTAAVASSTLHEGTATTSVLNSTMSNKQQHQQPQRPPLLQGFSSNTTSTTLSSVTQSTNNNNNAASSGKRRSKLVNSFLADGLQKLSRQKSLPARIRGRRQQQQNHDEPQRSQTAIPSSHHILKRASFTVKSHSSSDELHRRHESSAASTFSQQQQLENRVIIAASVEKLVEKLTNSLDYTFMTDFFLTYRTFISPTQLCKLLILRFQWALANDEDERRVVRIRTFVVMRHWLLNYFLHDFVHSRDLRLLLTSFLNSLAQDPIVRQSARDQRIVKGLKKVVRRLKIMHYENPPVARPLIGGDTLCEHAPDSSSLTGLPQHDDIGKVDPTIDRASMFYDDDGSLDSDLTPGNSECGELEDKSHKPLPPLPPVEIEHVEPSQPDNSAPVDIDWSEDPAITKLQYERRLREEEEERMRAEFFQSISSSTDGVSVPSLHSDVLSASTSSEPSTPMETADSKLHPTVAKIRPPLPTELVPLQHDSGASRLPNIGMSSSAPTPITVPSRRHVLPATIIHDVSGDGHDKVSKTIRRVPSKKWCKATPEENLPFNKDQFESEAKQQQQQQPAPPPVPAPTEMAEGLSRRLSRKSIERRRSEKNMRDAALAGAPSGTSSVASSAVSTPHLGATGAVVDNASSVPEIPPLPPAAAQLITHAASKVLGATPSFEALPYDMTTPAAVPSTSSNSEQRQSKRKLSKKFTKLFKAPQTDNGCNSNNDKPLPNNDSSASTSSRSSSGSTAPAATTTAPLPRTSVTVKDELSSKLEITDEQLRAFREYGPQQQPKSVHLLSQLAAELRDDDEEELELQLRRQRADSIDAGRMLQPRRMGPIYLSHLPDGLESNEAEAVSIVEMDESDNDEGHSTPTRGLSLRSNQVRTMSMVVEPDDRYTAMMISPDEPSITTAPPPSSPSAAVQQQISAAPKHQDSFILSYHSTKIVEQFCLIERQVLLSVEWEELIDCRWRNGTAAAPCGVQQLIQRFNSVCQWVASEIVLTKSVEERAELVRQYIRIAQKCKAVSNFASLFQILLGLQSPAIARLHKTWALVSQNDMRLLGQLSAFTSPTKNWKNIRDSMSRVAEEYGNKQEGESDEGGCIPFLGIYLSDLVFNAELQPYIEPVQRSGTCDSLLLQQPLVNFHKHRTTATVIKRVLTFQNLARRYPFTPIPELYRLCHELPSLDLDAIRKRSLEIEP